MESKTLFVLFLVLAVVFAESPLTTLEESGTVTHGEAEHLDVSNLKGKRQLFGGYGPGLGQGIASSQAVAFSSGSGGGFPFGGSGTSFAAANAASGSGGGLFG